MIQNDVVARLAPEVIAWRHRIHANPELGFEERETARFIAEKLKSFGLEVHEGIGGTGVVGALRNGGGARAIALRAELDALPILEKSGKPHGSRKSGVMHACGHDGHSAILIGAAKVLAETRPFDGTVYFVFQPAEEVLGGGKRMLEEGLFERFAVDGAYALHNWPGLALGSIAVQAGPMMAAVDDFDLRFTGSGCHAAMPHLGDDPVLATGEFLSSVQRIVSRSVDPQTPLVVSVTQLRAGSVNNIVPGEAWLQGTCRFFEPSLSDHCEKLIAQIAKGIAAAHGVEAALDYRKGYPPVVNSAEGAESALRAVRETVGPDRAVTDFPPSMGCEDFAFMVRRAGGAYAWIGAGPAGPREGLHGDRYDFNDEIVPIALAYWVNLVQLTLPRGGGR
jgi:hippurate hydrolase